jgi:hypothetical protein
MGEVWTSVILAAGVVVGPLLLAYLTGRQRSKDKQEDWARQDAVAAKADAVADQAAEAARLLRERQDEVATQAAEAARLMLAANERVAKQSADAAEVVSGKLGQIHELVNSNLTAQMEEAHGALTQQLVLMREVIALHRAAGREPSAEAVEAIALIGTKVGELHAKLADRAKATEIADAKVVGGR